MYLYLRGSEYAIYTEAIEVFQEAKILFAPERLLMAAVTSGLEMSQNLLRLNWTREEVDAKLKTQEGHSQILVEYGSRRIYRLC